MFHAMPGPPEEGANKMTYCWEIYNNNSKCETCKHYQDFLNGTLDLEKVKDTVIVDED